MQEEITNYLLSLRENIITAFECMETKDDPHSPHRFIRKKWDYQKGTGGGEIALLRGKVFEKAAVNFSAIEGPNFPMQDSSGPFFATGISLIIHMANPHAPTVHMNLRYLKTQDKAWFGGGYDLTPMGFPYDEDTLHFHAVARRTLDPFGQDIYPKFSQNAKEYFYIPHRKKERGVGGLFFDHYNTGDQTRDFTLWTAIGNTFLEAIMPILDRRISLAYSPQEKEKQLESRAHYVEFNLLYDRGTKFGFLSGGNPEAILCSMPPLVKW